MDKQKYIETLDLMYAHIDSLEAQIAYSRKTIEDTRKQYIRDAFKKAGLDPDRKMSFPKYDFEGYPSVEHSLVRDDGNVVVYFYHCRKDGSKSKRLSGFVDLLVVKD